MRKGSLMVEAAIVIPILFLVFVMLFRWENAEYDLTGNVLSAIESVAFRGPSVALSRYGLEFYSDPF